jgi:hypothetical protein
MRHLLALMVFSVFIPLAPRANAETVWFEIAARDPEVRESYLLPLNDPLHIAQARAFLANGEASGVGAIVVAQIRAGGDGLNRNLRAPDQRRWSWHVAGFVEFADFTIELCDGWPGFVEEDVAGFIANTDARICFWGYRLTAELPQAPTMAIVEALDGLWYNPATSGQGIAIDVLAEHGLVAVGWFTYRDPQVGDGPSTHRWLTGVGSINADTALIDIHESAGGRFNQTLPVTTRKVGELRLRFLDCNRGEARFVLDGQPEQSFSLQRTAPRYGCGAP